MYHKIFGIMGQFVGDGVNHDNEKFTGVMTLKPMLGNRGTSLSFTASGEGGVVFHDERSLIGFDPQGEIFMVSTSNNTETLMPYTLVAIDQNRVVFRFGDVNARDTFRETRELTIHDNQDITCRFSWGLPGESFAERSTVRMTIRPSR